jgi:F-type H+-transporting ATPase subunit b
MKLKAAIAALLSVEFCPALAFCAEGGEGGGSWLTLMFFTLNFAAFVYILVFFGAPYIGKFLRDRASAIRETLSRSETDAQRAQDIANQAAARAARLETDKAELAGETRAETTREIGRMRELARATAERIKRDAELTAAGTVDSARRRIRARLAQVATDLARDLVTRNLEASDQGRLIEDFMDRLRREAAKP